MSTVSAKIITESALNIGRKIAELRIAKGWSRAQVAVKVGVTQQQFAKYERAENRISACRLAVIAHALGTTVMYFYANKNMVTPPTKHQRLCLEVARNFAKIKDPIHREAVATLMKVLAAEPTKQRV